jgi:hypothetical protein
MIFKDGPKDIKIAVKNAMDYCLYDYCNQNHGNQSVLITEAEAHFGMTYGNKKNCFNNGKILFDSIPYGSPKTSISTKMIFDFYKNEKTESEISTFLAFAAIKSILQKQAYTKITNEYLISRMSGNSKTSDPIPESMFKYNNRYQLDKIKKELELNWGLKLYAFHTRGFYVSFSVELLGLITYAEGRKKKTKEKELQRKKNEARELALKQINGTAP